MSESPTFVDLFAGAGGLSLGLSRAGWQPIAAFDNWLDAVATYNTNLADAGHRCHGVDVTYLGSTVRLILERPEWIVGGPPCQGFSTVGRRRADDARNRLFTAFLAIVKALRPVGFLLENVTGLQVMQFERRIVEEFGSIGYKTTYQVLRSADFGVPQLRHRIIFVGHRSGGAFGNLRPTHDEHYWATVWDAIGDLPELRPGESATEYDKEPHCALAKFLRDDQQMLTSHVASRHPAHIVSAISFIPDGGNRKSIPAEYQPRSGFHNSYSRLASWKPAVAVTQNMGKPSATRCIHPTQHRGLTAREGARLQTFPDTYRFSAGIVSQRLQIANSVPPMLAEAIGAALVDETNWS